MKTIEGLRRPPQLEIFNSLREAIDGLQPRPLMILHQFEADVSITPDEHAV